ncbi:MAG: response regulator transcription factor [Myxococcales bacterium]|nr:response regulator transcription factor [Myxococcales bacterium]
MRLLLVEDNPKLGPMVARGLRGEGHVVDLATDGGAALEYTETATYDAIILDLMLPVLDGLGVLDRLRRRGDPTPVLILTAKDAVDSRVEGLDRGGDDYLVKPFAFDELLARLRALVRRTTKAGGTAVIRVGELEVDTQSKNVTCAGQPVRLSGKEYAILECLALRRNRVVTRETLLGAVYDGDELPESNVLEVYIGALRRKIDREHGTKLIHTRRGLGYVLSEAP